MCGLELKTSNQICFVGNPFFSFSFWLKQCCNQQQTIQIVYRWCTFEQKQKA